MNQSNSATTLINQDSLIGKSEIDLKSISTMTVETMHCLIDNGWDVNEVDDHQETPLHLACRHNLAIVPELIEQGGYLSLFKQNNCQELPAQFILNHLTEKSKETQYWAINIFDQMMACGISLNTTLSLKKPKITTDFHTELSAIFNELLFEQKDQLLNIIKNHESINKTSQYDGNNLLQSIFMFSKEDEDFYIQSEENIDLFINHGLDFNITNNSGENTLFTYLIKHTRLNRKLYNETGLFNNVLQLKQQIQQIDHVNYKNTNYLHLAFYNKSTQLVYYFLSQGLDVNQKNHQNQNSLILASKYCPETIESIIPQIQDINETDDFGETALFNLVQNICQEIDNKPHVGILIANGADTLIRNIENLNVWDQLEEFKQDDKANRPHEPYEKSKAVLMENKLQKELLKTNQKKYPKNQLNGLPRNKKML